MSSITFSQLPNQTTITANTIIPTVSGNINYTVSAANLQTYVNTNANAITANSISVTGNIAGSSTTVANLTVTGTTVLHPYVETTSVIGNVSSSFTPTMSNGPVQTITPTGNITIAAPSGMSQGQSITLIITQPANGNAIASFNSVYKFAYGINTLSTTGNAIDVMSIFYSGANYLCNLVKGYQ